MDKIYNSDLMTEKEKKYHSNLSEYFIRKPLFLDDSNKEKPNIRKLAELPWQEIHAEMWQELESTLCGLTFIECKCSSGMPYDLQTDFQRALNVIPRGQVRLHVNEFSEAYSQEILHLIGFANQGIAIPFADFVFQQLRNRIWRNTGGRIDLAVENQTNQRKRAVLLQRYPPKSNRFVRQMEAEAGANILRFGGTVRFSTKGNRLVVATVRREVLCLDPESGRESFTFDCVGRAVALDFSPDGGRLVVGGDLGHDNSRGFVQIFDFETGESLACQELEVPVYKLIVSVNREIFTALSCVVHVLDLDTLEIKRRWSPYENHVVFSIAVNKQRTLLATGEMHDEDHSSRISIWNTLTMELLTEIQGPKYGITSLAFSDFDGIVVSGSCHLNNGVVAWHWRLPGTMIDEMLLSVQHREQALELIRVIGRNQQVRDGRVISTLETQDSINSIVFFPKSTWIVAVEGSAMETSDAINVFNIFGGQRGSVGKICGNPTVPIAVDIDCLSRWVATLHANGEVFIWPAERLKEINSKAPPRALTNHSTDINCRFVLSGENDSHHFIHITDSETGKDILSGLNIPCHKAAIVPKGDHFVRFYWNQMPMNPYNGSNSTDEVVKQWFTHFVETTPICCTIHSIANLLASDNRTKGLPNDCNLIENLDLSGQSTRKWTFPPGTQALNICFSYDSTWGATIVGSQTVPAHIFCFAPHTGESGTFTIPKEIKSGFLIFDRDNSLYLIGVKNKDIVVLCFEIAARENEAHSKMYKGFGKAEEITFMPIPIGQNRFISIRLNEEIKLFESKSHQDTAHREIVHEVVEIANYKHISGIFDFSVNKDGTSLIISDGYPSITVFQLPSFRPSLWRPMDQIFTGITLDASETRLLVIGKMADLDGLHYALMEFPSKNDLAASCDQENDLFIKPETGGNN